MATVKVSTPVPGYSGSVGGVSFADGAAVVDEDAFAAEVGYFRRTGYTVEDVAPAEVVSRRQTREVLGFTAEQIAEMEVEDKADEESGDESDDDRLPKKSASTEAWRAYAVEHGMPQEEADGLSRDQLVELYTKENNS